jgi:prolyl-tRNA synthetase
MFVAYLRIFARMGIRAIPMRAETGPIGGDLSHEFLVLAQTGESAVYCDRAVLDLPIPGDDTDYDGDLEPIVQAWTARYAATEDVHDIERFEREVPAEQRVHTRGIEVGQVFYFGTKYSAPMKALVTTPEGDERPIHGGSYGIGVSRLLGAIIEAGHDDNGIVWPDAVAPFRVGLVNLDPADAQVEAACVGLQAQLEARGIDVLHDDTPERAGVKFARMDLLGLPWQVVVGRRGLDRGIVELKRRANGERSELAPGEVPAWLEARNWQRGTRNE